jgi:hypothetical protein
MLYRFADEIIADIAALQKANKPVCTVFNLENSVLHKPIQGLRIANDAVKLDYKPTVLITAGVHAREWAPPDAILDFLKELLAAYKAKGPIIEPGFVYKNRGILTPKGTPKKTIQLTYNKYIVQAQDVQDIVNRVVTYVIPMVNPDGRDFSLAVEPFWRKNRKQEGIWQMLIVRDATGGTYTLEFKGSTTQPIAWDATPSDVKKALEALPNVGAGGVIVLKPAEDCMIVRFLNAPAYSRMTANSTNLTGYGHQAVLVREGDGVDINRNFNFAWAKEIYDDFFRAEKVHSCRYETDEHAFDRYRGLTAASEVETQNVANTITGKQINYYLDLHLFAGGIFLPWGIEYWQGTDSSQWFGNTAWDNPPGTGKGRPGPPKYREWFPGALMNQHQDLAGAMTAEIERAAGSNKAYSDYEVKSASELYLSSGVASDYAASLQFLPDNKSGTENFSFTYEAGDKDGLDGGFHPDLHTGQFDKVARDIHAGVVGLLLKIIAWAKSGPLTPPPVAPH